MRKPHVLLGSRPLISVLTRVLTHNTRYSLILANNTTRMVTWTRQRPGRIRLQNREGREVIRTGYAAIQSYFLEREEQHVEKFATQSRKHVSLINKVVSVIAPSDRC